MVGSCSMGSSCLEVPVARSLNNPYLAAWLGSYLTAFIHATCQSPSGFLRLSSSTSALGQWGSEEEDWEETQPSFPGSILAYEIWTSLSPSWWGGKFLACSHWGVGWILSAFSPDWTSSLWRQGAKCLVLASLSLWADSSKLLWFSSWEFLTTFPFFSPSS